MVAVAGLARGARIDAAAASAERAARDPARLAGEPGGGLDRRPRQQRPTLRPQPCEAGVGRSGAARRGRRRNGCRGSRRARRDFGSRGWDNFDVARGRVQGLGRRSGLCRRRRDAASRRSAGAADAATEGAREFHCDPMRDSDRGGRGDGGRHARGRGARAPGAVASGVGSWRRSGLGRTLRLHDFDGGLVRRACAGSFVGPLARGSGEDRGAPSWNTWRLSRPDPGRSGRSASCSPRRRKARTCLRKAQAGAGRNDA